MLPGMRGGKRNAAETHNAVKEYNAENLSEKEDFPASDAFKTGIFHEHGIKGIKQCRNNHPQRLHGPSS